MLTYVTRNVNEYSGMTYDDCRGLVFLVDTHGLKPVALYNSSFA
jgi:hypothetical protein